MTSRTTPVGVLVLVLASLFAVGCTAQTSAVFVALLEPIGVPASPAVADASTDDAEPVAANQVWWPHPDGYAMTLPASWSGIALSSSQSASLIAAIDATYPGVAERIEAVLGATKSRVTAVAADLAVTADGGVAPLLVVVAQPTDGKRAHGVKTRVLEQISALPGIQGIPGRYDVRLPAGSGVRFEYTVIDPELGTLRAHSYLFRFGSQAYLISFVASQDAFDDNAEALFEAIAESLRFGI